ncbi:hypothetical protein L596_020935 [Steinernema carpocapsae]|uniref:G-protein coupled receptors family 1 profile domain-containing protein n=1 Tax=Steinernema carpocapsae TaxID=34508 RepID=A0A4U5MV06_STECR|nr:hypothetical protein L596_020935 [Steinernema carpocapsae]
MFLQLALLAVMLGLVNLYFIKTMPIFRNAFGWFWASRTFGEIMVNVIHAGYNAPVTLFQPEHIPYIVGILPYIFAYIFATGSCIMHAVVSLNRCIAVYSPLKYKRIFTRQRSFRVITVMWILVLISGSLLVSFPCNAIGYSPTLYEYIFVKCSPFLYRDFSIVGTIINCGCWLLCFCTVLTDISTLLRIIYIKKVLKWGGEDKNLRRDIRFFAQTSVQNLTMIMAVTTIVLANNRNHEDNKILHIFGFNTLLLTHVNNALSLIFFNPEVRNKIINKLTGKKDAIKKMSISFVQNNYYPHTQRLKSVGHLYAQISPLQSTAFNSFMNTPDRARTSRKMTL